MAALVAALTFEEVVGIAGIASLVVALLGLGLMWRYRQRPQPASASIDRCRQLAEDGAAELTDTRAIIDGIWLGLLQHGRGYFKRAEADGERQRLREVGEDLDRRRARLRVGFGIDSDAAQAFDVAADAVVEIHRATGAIRDLHTDPPVSGDEHAQRQVDEYFDADRETVGEERQRYADAVERFEAAAGEVN